MNTNRLSCLTKHVFLGSFVFSLVAFSASTASVAQTTASDVGIQFVAPAVSTWEFGLRIKSTGNSKRILATAPIPMSWPEQQIELLEEVRTGQVGKFRTQSPTKESKQFSFLIGAINGGHPEEAYIRFKVNKMMIVAPESTSIFSIPERPKSSLRDFLKPSPFIESKHKRIKAIAKELKDESLTGWKQAEAIYKWVRENVEYKFDKQIHSCLDALDRKQGDCEELSSLFIAICRAQGIPARAVWVPGHTYPEFYLEDNQGNGHWFPCQAAGSYQFGEMTETRPILHKGDRFKIRNEQNKTVEVRYLRPTLICKQPMGSLGMEWITRETGTETPGASENNSAISSPADNR